MFPVRACARVCGSSVCWLVARVGCGVLVGCFLVVGVGCRNVWCDRGGWRRCWVLFLLLVRVARCCVGCVCCCAGCWRCCGRLVLCVGEGEGEGVGLLGASVVVWRSGFLCVWCALSLLSPWVGGGCAKLIHNSNSFPAHITYDDLVCGPGRRLHSL